jgi:hypothetical protein
MPPASSNISDLFAACVDSNIALTAAETALTRVNLLRNHLAQAAVRLDAVDQIAYALKTTPAKLRQMAVAHDLTNPRPCC